MSYRYVRPPAKDWTEWQVFPDGGMVSHRIAGDWQTTVTVTPDDSDGRWTARTELFIHYLPTCIDYSLEVFMKEQWKEGCVKRMEVGHLFTDFNWGCGDNHTEMAKNYALRYG